MYLHKQPEPIDPRGDAPIVYLIVGLPGAGKTTRAKELETSASALRITPDEWQIALFGNQDLLPDKRGLLEGKLVQLGMRAAELGSTVVFDFGLWGKDERSALRWIAGTVGARSQVVYLPIDPEEQRRRVTNRFATKPDQTFQMSDLELEQWRAQFQAPDEVELRGSQIPRSHQRTQHGQSGHRNAGHPCQTGTPRPQLTQATCANCDVPRADRPPERPWPDPGAGIDRLPGGSAVSVGNANRDGRWADSCCSATRCTAAVAG